MSASPKRRSPWDAVRSAILNHLIERRSKRINCVAHRVYWDAAVNQGRYWVPKQDVAQIQSEALEFIAWAELQGLTPETMGKVAA